jgi:hypothetical protein
MNEQNWTNKFNSSSQVTTTSITELLVTTLYVSIIYKEAWFIDFGASFIDLSKGSIPNL